MHAPAHIVVSISVVYHIGAAQSVACSAAACTCLRSTRDAYTYTRKDLHDSCPVDAVAQKSFKTCALSRTTKKQGTH